MFHFWLRALLPEHRMAEGGEMGGSRCDPEALLAFSATCLHYLEIHFINSQTEHPEKPEELLVRFNP